MAISSVGSTITGAGATSISGVIKSISFGGMSTASIDTTSITSAFKSYVMGMADYGTVSVSCFAENGLSKPDIPVGGLTTPLAFVVQMGTGTGSPIYTFSGYVTSASLSAGIDEAVTVDYTLRISGAITFTTAV